MQIRYYVDPATGQPHINRHRVDEEEVEEVLSRPIEDRPGRDDARVALGQTRAGRHLRIIYVPDPMTQSVFVITGYELGPKSLRALRRRQRRKS